MTHEKAIVVKVPPLSNWAQWTREILVNGCGSTVSRFYDVPDWVFERSCNEHDRDYLIGGPMDLKGDSTWRNKADLLFYDRMIAAARKQPWYVRYWYIAMARVYYNAVDSFGSDPKHFEYRDPGDVITLELLLKEESERQKITGRSRVSPMTACIEKQRGMA